MSEPLNFYQQQASARLSTIPWLAHMQKVALADFTRMGFPTRNNEDWKYTTVDSFLQERFSSEQNASSDAAASPLCQTTPVPVVNSYALMNGNVVDSATLMAKLPPGVVVQPLVNALIEHAEKIKPYLSTILQQQHGFQALNTAMLNDGLFIYLPEGVCVPSPILLSHWQDKANQATYTRHLIIAEAGSSAVIFEDYQGDASTCYFTNTITEIYLAAQAKMTHYKIQRESKLAYHMGHLAVKQAEGSQFNSHSFNVGGKWVRSDITIGLDKPEAQCLMNGVYAPADGQHIDHHTLVTHAAPNCRSEQDYKGILSGHSRAVFNGRVIVAKDAQHTQAKQQNKNLLLSKSTEIDTKPQLEIFANDVVCTHGATVGQLDEDALFYLATRGIGRVEASRYLVQAFAVENLRLLANVELADWVGTLLNQQLG